MCWRETETETEREEHRPVSSLLKEPVVSVFPVATSIPTAHILVFETFSTTRNQDYLEKWLTPGWCGKRRRWA